MTGIIRAVFALIVVVLLAIGAWVIYLYAGPHPIAEAPSATSTTASTLSPDQTAAIATVISFGKAEQLVSLLAPDASTTLATDYGPYVTSSLLSSWESDPQSAPGRVTSSPWPDHITIDSVTQTTSGYEVKGTLIMMTSDSVENGGNDGTDPVVIDLVHQGGQWLIASYTDLNAG